MTTRGKLIIGLFVVVGGVFFALENIFGEKDTLRHVCGGIGGAAIIFNGVRILMHRNNEDSSKP